MVWSRPLGGAAIFTELKRDSYRTRPFLASYVYFPKIKLWLNYFFFFEEIKKIGFGNSRQEIQFWVLIIIMSILDGK